MQALVQYKALIGQMTDGITQQGIPQEMTEQTFRSLFVTHRLLFKVRLLTHPCLRAQLLTKICSGPLRESSTLLSHLAQTKSRKLKSGSRPLTQS